MKARRLLRAATGLCLLSPLWTGLCLLSALGLVTARGEAQPLDAPVVNEVAVENEGAMSAFHDALRRFQRTRSEHIRIVHWGDSNVAADLWTRVTRQRLQAQFGNGGSGYILPRGHGSLHRGPVSIYTRGTWRSMRRGFARQFGPADGLWGLAGVGIEPASAGSQMLVQLDEADAPRRVEVHLLGRPKPRGVVEVRVDREAPVSVDTKRDTPGLTPLSLSLAPGNHLVRIRHSHGVPRVLGVLVERPAGLVYNVLGIIGHRASAILHWDRTLLSAQLGRLRPNLVILSYGGNEGIDPLLPMPRYERQLRRAVSKVRALAPYASCLLVGPLATCPRHAARMRQVTEVQRRVAPELGCGFWDASQVMGGHGNLCRNWRRFPGMVGKDRLHLGRQGYETVGRVFSRALLGPLNETPLPASSDTCQLPWQGYFSE